MLMRTGFGKKRGTGSLKRPAPVVHFLAAVVASAIPFFGCDKNTPTEPTTQSNIPTIASMVPAATDLIVGMGASSQLVAVSTYDHARPDVGSLPKAGDYQTVDWEVLRTLRPTVLVTEIDPGKQSPGFVANANELHIESLNVKIEQLDDIFQAAKNLGIALHKPALADAAIQQMRGRLDAVRNIAAREKPVSVLLVIDSAADAIVGPGTYLDDLLKCAGGVNAAAGFKQHWPQIDREMLLSLNPEVIIQLLPDASPQERAKAIATWQQLPQIPAVAAGRVYPIYDGYALLPGWHVTDLAEQFSRCLHPSLLTTRP